MINVTDKMPFIYAPTSVEVRTQSDGLVTLDGDTYAKVKICCGVDGTFEVDGEVFIDRTITNRDINSGSFTTGSTKVFIGSSANCAKVGGVTINSNAGNPPSNRVVAGNSHLVESFFDLGTGNGLAGYEESKESQWLEIWVPPGTTLEGTVNCKYLVESYADPKA